MSNWVLHAIEDLLVSLYDAMRAQLVQHSVLHADETTWQVLQEPGKAAQSKSYMWLYGTSGDAEKPIVLYKYKVNYAIAYEKVIWGTLQTAKQKTQRSSLRLCRVSAHRWVLSIAF